MGQIIFMHNSLYHCVVGAHVPRRIYINHNFAARPATPAALASLWRNRSSSCNGFAPAETLLQHERPEVRRLVEGMGELVGAAEDAARSEPHPDAALSPYCDERGENHTQPPAQPAAFI